MSNKAKPKSLADTKEFRDVIMACVGVADPTTNELTHRLRKDELIRAGELLGRKLVEKTIDQGGKG